MSYAVALVSLALFVVAFRLARIVPTALGALQLARNAVGVIADRSKSEDEKERAARRAAVALFGRFFLITSLSIAALVPSVILLFLAAWLRLAEGTALMDAFLSPWLIAAAILFFAADYLVRR